MSKVPLKLIYILLIFLFFGLQLNFFNKRTQSFDFSDENEHLAPAMMMIKGKRLYQDLSTNHQPLPIFASYIFYKVVPKINAFMFIERVRQALFFLSFIAAATLTLRFGLKGLISSIFIELIKFYFLGYHLLAESLVVYPIMFITGLLFELVISKPRIKQSSLFNTIDNAIYGLSTFWIAFNLLPAWPFLLFSFFLYLKSKYKNKYSIKWILLSLILPLLPLCLLIDPFSWFQETVVNNYKYFLPFETHLSPHDYVRLLTYPLLSVWSLGQPIAQYYGLLFLLTLSCLFFLILYKKNDKHLTVSLILFYVLSVLLNLRVPTLNVGFYSAFHLLPQAAFITMFVSSLIFFSKNILSSTKKTKIFISLSLLLGIALFTSSTSWWKESKTFDKLNDHFIQYGEDESVSMAVSSIKQDTDTLLAGPQSGFINIFADIPLATRQTAYLEWAYRSPTLRNEFNTIIQKSPPTFIYFPESDNPYYKTLKPTLDKSYLRIQRTSGGYSNLYILSTAVNKINRKQWEKFQSLDYKPAFSSVETY